MKVAAPHYTIPRGAGISAGTDSSMAWPSACPPQLEFFDPLKPTTANAYPRRPLTVLASVFIAGILVAITVAVHAAEFALVLRSFITSHATA